AVLVTAGIYLSILRLPHLRDLWTVGYGRVLVVKLGLVSVALAWGGLHKLVALPAVERGEGRILARLPRSLAGESAVAMAVLLVAAVLVDSKPPRRPVSPAAARETGLLALRRILDELGSLDAVERWVKVLGFVRSAPGFGDQPAVVNGFTELVVEVYGEERGFCARSAIGVAELPAGIPVEVEAIVALR